MITVSEHQRTVAALLAPSAVVSVPTEDALGMALATELIAPISLPSFDNSAMDGYAALASDIAEAPLSLPVTEDIPAGRVDVPALAAGTAHRIMTGAALPAGADVVVQVELTDGGTERVHISTALEAGTHIRRSGSDVKAGTAVLAAGGELGPSALGLASALGYRELPVHRRPTVLVLSTGSELVPAGEPLRPGQIYDSNGIALASAVREAGAQAIRAHAVADDVDAFLRVLDAHITEVDLIITSGGVSAGAYEVVKDALANAGVRFVKVAMQPGGPQGAGHYRGVPVITLPGNPVSSLVSFEVFVRPLLRATLGHSRTSRPLLHAELAEAIDSRLGTRQFRRGHYAQGTVSMVGGPGSHLLGSMAVANCLVIVDEETEHLPKGSRVGCLAVTETSPF